MQSVLIDLYAVLRETFIFLGLNSLIKCSVIATIAAEELESTCLMALILRYSLRIHLWSCFLLSKIVTEFILFHPCLRSTNMYAQLSCRPLKHSYIYQSSIWKNWPYIEYMHAFQLFHSYTSLDMCSTRRSHFLQILGVWCKRFNCKKSLIDNVIHRLRYAVLINSVSLSIFVEYITWQAYYSIYKFSSIFFFFLEWSESCLLYLILNNYTGQTKITLKCQELYWSLKFYIGITKK